MSDRIPVSVTDLAAALEHMEVSIDTKQGIMHGTLHWPTAVATDALKAIHDAGPDEPSAAHSEPEPPASLISGDPELEALDVIVTAMIRLESGCEGGTVTRVMRYLCERYLT